MSLDREQPPTAPDLAPQGDRFEDQYTSATSDLSAGGVAAAGGAAAAFESLDAGATAPTERMQTPVTPGAASTAPTGAPVLSSPTQYALPAPSRTRMMLQPRNVAVGAGVAAGLGAVIGGWLYNRWQREQNRPINRLRRGARDVADLVADRLPLDELPGNTAPVGGAAALAVTSLLLTRVLRSSSDNPGGTGEEDRRERKRFRDMTVQDFLDATARQRAQRAEQLGAGAESLAGGSERLTEALRAGLTASSRKARRAARDLPSVDLEEVRSRSAEAVGGRRGAFMGLGASGLVAVAASAYVVWRLLRGSNPPRTYPQPM